LVDEAVTFWNKTLAEIGSSFRLGSVTHIVQLMPEEALQSLSQSVLGASVPLVGRAFRKRSGIRPGTSRSTSASRSMCHSPAHSTRT
jgi:hypothetical protein